MKTTGTPAAEWPPGGASSTTSTASQRRAATDFGALLGQHQARTAVAEGPKNKEARPEHKLEKQAPARERHETPEASAPVQPQAEPKAAEAKPEATAPATEQQQSQPQPEGEGSGQPTVETPVVAVDPLVELTQPVLAEPQPSQPTAPVAQAPAAEVPAQQQPVAAEQVPAPAEAPVATAPVAAEAPVITGQPVEAAVAKPATEPQPQPAAAPVVAEEAKPEGAAPQTTDAPAARADKPAQPQQQSGQPQQQQQPGEQPKQGADQRPADGSRATAPQPAQLDAAAKPEAKAAPAPAPVSAPAPQASVTAPAAAAAPQATSAAPATAPVRSVPLSRAAEAVENVIRLGSARGVTHARMSLKPAELGGVEIRLQQTATGLVASVVADGAEAAQALQQAGHDLRRQLESHGIELQRLDISYSGDDRSGGRAAEARTGDGERRSPAGNDSHATDGGDLTPTDEATALATLELPGGVLVDVLA